MIFVASAAAEGIVMASNAANPINNTHPTGLWAIERKDGKLTKAIPGPVDTIRSLANQTGLRDLVMNRLILLMTASIVSLFASCAQPCKVPKIADKPIETIAGAGRNALSPEVLETEIQNLKFPMVVYRCGPMVNVINHLRTIGKNAALDVLNHYYATKVRSSADTLDGQLTIMCICRLLFKPPSAGWKEPWSDFNQAHGAELVRDGLHFSPAARANFPIYPMVMSDGVPFFVSNGYSHNGGVPRLTEEAQSCLDECRQLELIDADLPTSGYDKAALKLVGGKAFNALFDPQTDSSQIALVDLWIVFQAIDPDYLTFQPK